MLGMQLVQTLMRKLLNNKQLNTVPIFDTDTHRIGHSLEMQSKHNNKENKPSNYTKAPSARYRPGPAHSTEVWTRSSRAQPPYDARDSKRHSRQQQDEQGASPLDACR